MYRVIYFGNAAMGLVIGLGLLLKSITNTQTDILVGGLLCSIYGVIFAYVFYLVMFKPIIFVENNNLLDRRFFRKNKTYMPLSDYSANITNIDNIIILSKDGKEHPISSNHLKKKDAEKLYDYLSKICSNNALHTTAESGG